MVLQVMRMFYFSSDFDGIFFTWFVSLRASSSMPTGFISYLFQDNKGQSWPKSVILHHFVKNYLFDRILMELSEVCQKISYQFQDKRVKCVEKCDFVGYGKIFILVRFLCLFFLNWFILLRALSVCQRIFCIVYNNMIIICKSWPWSQLSFLCN